MWRLFDVFARHRDRKRRDIDAELEAHLDARIDHLVEQGWQPEAARSEALRRFGDLESGRATLHALAAEARPRLDVSDYLHDLGQDVRYVARGLAGTPAFTLGVAATLALGLGVNTTVFRVADVVLFRAPAGVTDAGSVRWLESELTLGSGVPSKAATFSYLEAKRVVDSNAFAGTSMFSPPRVMQDQVGAPVGVSYVDGPFFRVLGVRTRVGRAFDPSEAAPGSNLAAAVVSFDYWQRKLGTVSLDTRPSVTLGGRTYPVIGVTDPGFTGIEPDPVDVWLPLGVADLGHGNVNGVNIAWYQTDALRTMRVVGRMPSRQGEAAVASRVGAALRGGDDDQIHIRRAATLHPIVPIGGAARNQEPNKLLGRLTIISAILLVIVCANVVNLLLARGLRRHQEIAIRMAIGASRSRVSRLLLVEAVMLAILGGGAAVMVGQWSSESLRRLLFPDARWTTSAFDQRTIVFTALLALAAGLAAGLAPALQSTTPDLMTGLKTGRVRGGSKTRATRTVLIVVQTALSLALLVASGLLVRSLMRLNAVNLGFEPAGLVTASVDTGFAGERTGNAIDATTLAQRVHAMPGTPISGVALASSVPFGVTSVMDVTVIGSSFVPEGSRDGPQWAAVSANYFSVMRTRVLQGRAFADGDVLGSDLVAVINDSMARRYFPSTIPPGSCIRPSGRLCARIVGVVEDVRDAPGGGPPPMRFYLPLGQWERPAGGVIIRTTAESAALVATAVKSAIPATQRTTIEVIADRVDRAMRPWHMATWLFVGLGIVALALACVGVYSVMSYVASERMHELGVRVVLGATGGDVMRLVLTEGLRLTMLGGLAGALTAAAAGRLLGSLLFDVSPFDPVVYALGLLCLAAAALGAVLPPARKASAVDPLTALRQD